MNSTTIKYQPIIRKTYVSPWIHVRELDLRGRMMQGVSAIPEDPEGEWGNDHAKESYQFFDDPFQTDFEKDY